MKHQGRESQVVRRVRRVACFSLRAAVSAAILFFVALCCWSLIGNRIVNVEVNGVFATLVCKARPDAFVCVVFPESESQVPSITVHAGTPGLFRALFRGADESPVVVSYRNDAVRAVEVFVRMRPALTTFCLAGTCYLLVAAWSRRRRRSVGDRPNVEPVTCAHRRGASILLAKRDGRGRPSYGARGPNSDESGYGGAWQPGESPSRAEG